MADRQFALINHAHYPISNAERDQGLTPVDLSYDYGHILRWGKNTTPGTTDMSTALQNAVLSLDKTYGGVVTVPAGRYLAGDILVDKDVFTNGGVWFELDPRAVIDIKPAATYGIKFQGTSTSSLLQLIGVRGGRLVGTEDGANYGIWLENCGNWWVENTSLQQFFSSPRATSAGLYTQYAIYGTVVNPNIQTCDFGMNFENDSGNTKRQTAVNIFGGNVQTCLRALRVDDCIDVNAYGTSFENSSIGVLYDYTRTTGTNNASCNLSGCYFERNGRHVQITEHGTGISRGINIGDGNFFENVAATYASTDAFEDANSGEYKLDIDGSYHNISWNYWSTAANTADILIQSGATGNYIGPQGRATGDVSVTDNGTGTYNDKVPITGENDITINGKFRHADELRLSNNIKMRGMNNAGTNWRDLMHITTSDRVTVGNTVTDSQIYSSAQPRWYDGSNTEWMTSSDGDTGGSASAGAGNQYVEVNINGTVYKVLHDGTV